MMAIRAIYKKCIWLIVLLIIDLHNIQEEGATKCEKVFSFWGLDNVRKHEARNAHTLKRGIQVLIRKTN